MQIFTPDPHSKKKSKLIQKRGIEKTNSKLERDIKTCLKIPTVHSIKKFAKLLNLLTKTILK